MKNKISYYSLYFFLTVFFSFQNYRMIAQPIARLDTNKIFIGQQFHLDLIITSKAQNSIRFPFIGDTIISQIEVVEKSGIDTTYDKNDITLKTLHQRITLTSFDSGFFAIPPFSFLIDSVSFETEPQLIEVQTIQVDSTELADIKDPLDVRYSFIDWLKDNWKLIAVGLAVLIGISVLIYFLFKQKPKVPVVVEKPKALIPAHEIALQKLDKLKEKKLWQSDKVKEYHSELSEILREYLENRFHISALEQTTHEIFHSMRSISLDPDLMEKLRQLLLLSDLVKFAKELPLATENEMSLNFAYVFIEKSKASGEKIISTDGSSEIKQEIPRLI